MDNRRASPPALKAPPRRPRRVTRLRGVLGPPKHCHGRKAKRGNRSQPTVGGVEGIARVAYQHVAAQRMARARKAGVEHTAGGRGERLKSVARIIGEKAYRARAEGGEQLDLIILQRERLEPAGKADPATVPVEPTRRPCRASIAKTARTWGSGHASRLSSRIFHPS